MPQTWRGEHILEVAVAAVKGGDFVKAAELCVQALKVKPDLAEAWHLRGICLLRQQRFFDAALHFDKALAIKEDMGDAWNNLGIAFAENGMWEAAANAFQKSLSIAKTVEPHIMHGGMLAHLMQLEPAEREFKAALEIEPDNQDAHVKLGVIQLGLGNWADGFKEYHWRWYNTVYPPKAFRSFPRWNGEDLTAATGEGSTLLLYAEQGYGDEIMSLRFVVPMAKRAERIILEVRPMMVRLAKRSVGTLAEVIASGDSYPDGIDFSLPLLEVPMALGMTPQTIPHKHYLRLPVLPENLMARMSEAAGSNMRVGICWSSGRRPLQPETERSASAKSIPLELFRPILGTKGVTFFSLQIPRQPIPQDMPIVDVTDHIDDMLTTAEIMAGLDLVISVDTSVAHLAGAMGVPVWNLVRFNGYWPWMRETLDTVWYQSMRIFRQPELGDWPTVIDGVADKLQRMVG